MSELAGGQGDKDHTISGEESACDTATATSMLLRLRRVDVGWQDNASTSGLEPLLVVADRGSGCLCLFLRV